MLIKILIFLILFLIFLIYLVNNHSFDLFDLIELFIKKLKFWKEIQNSPIKNKSKLIFLNENKKVESFDFNKVSPIKKDNFINKIDLMKNNSKIKFDEKNQIWNIYNLKHTPITNLYSERSKINSPFKNSKNVFEYQSF